MRTRPDVRNDSGCRSVRGLVMVAERRCMSCGERVHPDTGAWVKSESGFRKVCAPCAAEIDAACDAKSLVLGKGGWRYVAGMAESARERS